MLEQESAMDGFNPVKLLFIQYGRAVRRHHRLLKASRDVCACHAGYPGMQRPDKASYATE
jgi:hypothetical protein